PGGNRLRQRLDRRRPPARTGQAAGQEWLWRIPAGSDWPRGGGLKVIATALPGCLLIEPQVFSDDRGHFFESFNHDKLAPLGLNPHFVQGNVSRSSRGVLRGLHYQWPKPQGKFVSVTEGEVWDVAVDIR